MNFRGKNVVTISQVPLLYCHIFANWKKLVLVLNFKSTNAICMAFKVKTFFNFAYVPNFYEAIISTWDYLRLRWGELGHSYTGIMFSDDTSLVFCKIFTDLSYFNLYNKQSTFKSLEQVTRFLSFLDQSKQKMDLVCSPSIW